LFDFSDGFREMVRSAVHQARESSFMEVTLWGQTWPVELNHGVAPVHHRLSLAARAFKAHALAAAAVPTDGVDPVETFRTATPRSPHMFVLRG